MAKTDWSITDVVRPQDMNSIGAEINQLRDDVDHIEVPLASTNQAGIVQLSNATNGAREDVAATEWAVAQAFQAGNERKAQAVAVLVAKGVSATVAESWDSIISKLTALVIATGNAAAADILAGKTASNVNGPVTGSMPNLTGIRNATGVAKWGDGALAVYPEKGYQKGGSGDGEIKVSTANLNPWHFRSDVNMFGLQGAIPIRRPDMSTHINAGVSFGPYSGDGVPYIYLGVPNGHLLEGVEWARYHDPNLHSGNVRSGVPLFGGALVGTMQPSLQGTTYVNIPSTRRTYYADEYIPLWTIPAGVKLVNFSISSITVASNSSGNNSNISLIVTPDNAYSHQGLGSSALNGMYRYYTDMSFDFNLMRYKAEQSGAGGWGTLSFNNDGRLQIGVRVSISNGYPIDASYSFIATISYA